MKRCIEKEKRGISASLEILRQANEAEKDIDMTEVHYRKFQISYSAKECSSNVQFLFTNQTSLEQ